MTTATRSAQYPTPATFPLQLAEANDPAPHGWDAVETDTEPVPFACAPNGPGYYAPHIHQSPNAPDWFTYRRVGGDWWTAQRNVLPGEGTPVWFDETPEPTQDSPE